uniref:C2H2-type domain-containing protein n=1 Tax=Lutzomyia longipalpis TaxID=7200 RepID=A0A1B0CNG8_LUTLO
MERERGPFLEFNDENNHVDAETKKLCEMDFPLRDVLEDTEEDTATPTKGRTRKDEYNPSEPTKCPKCPRMMPARMLHKHFQSHSFNFCSMCLAIFSNISFLAKHKTRCLKRPLRLQKNNWRYLPSWFDLSRAKENILPCPVCKEEYGSVSELLDHLVVHDSAKETFTCGPCSAVFYSMNELKKHMFKHVLADQRKAPTEAPQNEAN